MNKNDSRKHNYYSFSLIHKIHSLNLKITGIKVHNELSENIIISGVMIQWCLKIILPIQSVSIIIKVCKSWPDLWPSITDIAVCDNICQWLIEGQRYSTLHYFTFQKKNMIKSKLFFFLNKNKCLPIHQFFLMTFSKGGGDIILWCNQ